MVYAIGRLELDFLSPTHLASLSQRLGFHPSDQVTLVKHLKKTPSDAELISWILTIEETPRGIPTEVQDVNSTIKRGKVR